MGKPIPIKSFPQISVGSGNYAFLENPQNNTHFVISALLHVMSSKLPIENVPSTQISFSEDRGNPVCDRMSGVIILTAKPTSWCQLAYQLAHEMCHRVIPNDVVQNLRWLEESICELSSYYFLPLLTEYLQRNKLRSLELANTNIPYYPEFKKYVSADRQKAEPLKLSSFASDTPPSELQLLINNCELRGKNAYIATSLLPVFNKYPRTWHAIPFLCTLSSDLSLKASLTEWIKLSPKECHIGLQKIAKIFGVELPPE